MSKKISKEKLEDIIEKFISYAEEERDLALERYRRQDELILSPEDFVLQGKNAVDFLKTASERSNSLLGVAKMIKEIVYVKNEDGGNNKEIDDEMKKEILRQIREEE